MGLRIGETVRRIEDVYKRQRLTRAFPDRAKELFARNQEVANDRYEHLTRLVDLYK